MEEEGEMIITNQISEEAIEKLHRLMARWRIKYADQINSISVKTISVAS